MAMTFLLTALFIFFVLAALPSAKRIYPNGALAESGKAAAC